MTNSDRTTVLADSASRPPTRQRLARLVTEILAPIPTVTTLLLVVAWHSTASIAEALTWAGLAIVFASGVPLLYLVLGVRRRRLTDYHVRRREQRPIGMIVGVLSVIIGLGLLATLGAPRDLVALVAAMLVGLAVALLVTLVWKISIHVAVGAGTVVILVLVFGPTLLLLTPLIALSGWARAELGDHTPAQVVAGAVLGATVAATIFTLLR